MRLKNILIVVENIEKSVEFYTSLFGLRVINDFDGNVIMTEGLVLQDRKIWETFIGKDISYSGHDAELYFVENNMDRFSEKLENSSFEIEYVNPLMEHAWGQRVIRIYDPDRHIIEVGEELDGVACRFLKEGMTREEIAQKMQLPLDYIQEMIGE